MESSNLSILRGDDRPIRARADAITRYAGGRFVRGRGRGRGHGRWAMGDGRVGVRFSVNRFALGMYFA